MPVQPPLKLTAFEYRKRLEKGSATRPFVVAARDAEGNERHLVLKVRQPDTMLGVGHHGPTSLAVELACSMIARSVGLPVPDYAVVEVTEEFADTATSEKAQELLRANIGPNFGCEYHDGFFDSVPPGKLAETHEALLAFDSTIFNPDRTIHRPNVLRRGDEVLLIDHSLALPVTVWPPALVDESPLMSDGDVRDHCTFPHLQGAGCQFSELHSAWQGSIEKDDLAAIRAHIPSEWETGAGQLDLLFKFLENRPVRFADIVAELRRIAR